MRRPLLLLAAAVVAFAAWLVLRPGGETGNGAVTVAAGARGEAPAPAAAAPSGAGVTRAATPPGEAPSPVPSPADDDGVLASSDEPSALRVRCIDRDTGAPLAGALVYRLDQSGADEEAAMRAMMTGASIPDMIARLGDTYRTGEDGEVRVPHGSDLAIAGRHGETFQVRILMEPAPEELVVLDLFRQPRFAVEVVGADGSPRPGADVAMRMFWDTWRFDVLVQHAGGDGHAHFRDFSTLLETAIGETLFVGLSEVLPEAVEMPIPEGYLEEDQPAPLRLVMPPTGSVDVRVRDHTGAPCRDGTIVRLVVDDPADDDEELGGGDGRAATALTVGGLAHFDYVGLGLQLRAAAWLNGPTSPSDARGPGPQAVGEAVTLTIEEDLRGSGVFGRLVHAGRPFADRDLHLTLRRRSVSGDWEDDFFLVSGPDGGFRAQFRPPGADELRERELFVEAEAGGEPLLARAALPGDFGSGFVDLGTLELEAAPTLAAGRVVDAGGAPVVGADVAVEALVNSWSDDPAEAWWQEQPGLDATTGRDGAFRIAGLPPGQPRLRVLATHPDGRPARVEFDLGAEGLLVRMQAAGRLEGEVLAAEGFPYGRLELNLEYDPQPAPEEVEDVYLWDDVDPLSREFRFGGLPPGTAALVVEDDDTGRELARVDGVAVRPGAPTDPRLRPLDLRGRVYAHRIRVRDETGAPLDDVELSVLAAPDRTVDSEDGAAVVLSVTPRCDVLAAAPGYRSQVRTGVDGEAEIVLQRGIPVVLEWRGGAPPVGRAWIARLRPGAGHPAWTESAWTEFDASGEARTRLSAPGSWNYLFSVYDEDGTHAFVTGEGGEPWPLEVVDGTAPQRFIVGLDEAALERARQALAAAREGEDG